MRQDTDHREAGPRKPLREPPSNDENEIGYRNVDEEAEHDERGPQGPGPEENAPREH